jgi:preprotein translocase subunit SecA
MIASPLRKLFGSRNDRQVRQLRKTVDSINALEPDMQALSDEGLRAQTAKFRSQLEQGTHLDDLLPEAFATVREASQRYMGMRHFDVQLIGGIVLHMGRIAEMRTGEGKTLMATLAAYLNALPGMGVHVVTVNDYLARRDANWMRPLYEGLGLSVGIVVPHQPPEEKRAAYMADITYGTNNEFGFDYLRDNMAFSLEDKAQRGLHFAIVDEVDSILIDEARTPLIISGAVEDSSELYKVINGIVPRLTRGQEEQAEDFTIDEKQRSLEITEQGHQCIEETLAEIGLLKPGESLYAAQNLRLLHHVHAALKAHHLFSRDVEYIVHEGQVVLIDEHTGRPMLGRRLSEGLHQAIEAKEGLEIHAESQTLASTTFQNYFRLYDKLSGMTGTADTEAYEFQQIYGLEVLVIPTHKPMIRNDTEDQVFMSLQEKYEAIVRDIQACEQAGRPVLVGTASIESSEHLSSFLRKAGVPHEVLNAKQHAREAEIIAQAGRPGAVTIATNMAGRGTDIVLGGNWEAEAASHPDRPGENIRAAWQERHDAVIGAGGLHIIGTERHESRRIDNQLRGRAGRQGDPGSSRFYLSLDDNLLRIFMGDKARALMQLAKPEHGEAIEARMLTRSIEKAQRKVEGRNFDIRKQLLEYDDVANEQRQLVYHQRAEIMAEEDLGDLIESMAVKAVTNICAEHIPPGSVFEQWDIKGLEQAVQNEFGLELPIAHWLDEDKTLDEDGVQARISEALKAHRDAKAAMVGEDALRQFERQVLLRVFDDGWKEHLSSMDHLRQGIHLRGYAARNPKQEYKQEAFALFQGMLDNIRLDVTRIIARVRISQEEAEEIEARRREEAERQQMAFEHAEAGSGIDEAADARGDTQGAVVDAAPEAEEEAAPPRQPVRREAAKVGRNEPCPCGSGKKYKHCCGKIN